MKNTAPNPMSSKLSVNYKEICFIKQNEFLKKVYES